MNRNLGFQLFDQSFDGMWDADRKLARLEQRLKRLDRRRVTTAAEREDARESDIERGLVQIGDQTRRDIVIFKVHAAERANGDATKRG